MLRILTRGAAVAAIPLALTGCYVVPVYPDGSPAYPAAVVPAPVVSGPAAPASLQERLYPSNEIATQTGMLSGSVTNTMNGKGRFQLVHLGS